MPLFKIEIVAYRDVVVEAEDKEVAEQWYRNRQGNAVFNEPTGWQLNELRWTTEEENGKACVEVLADGTCKSL